MPLGNRVVDADDLRRALGGLNEGASPTIRLMQTECAERNWPLETWATDLPLTCQVGQQFDDSNDERVRNFLERRSGPIGAALAASITLPDGD